MKTETFFYWFCNTVSPANACVHLISRNPGTKDNRIRETRLCQPLLLSFVLYPCDTTEPRCCSSTSVPPAVAQLETSLDVATLLCSFMIFASPTMLMLKHFSACARVFIHVWVYVCVFYMCGRSNRHLVLQHCRLWHPWACCVQVADLPVKSRWKAHWCYFFFTFFFFKNDPNCYACVLNLADFILVHCTRPAQHV